MNAHSFLESLPGCGKGRGTAREVRGAYQVVSQVLLLFGLAIVGANVLTSAL